MITKSYLLKIKELTKIAKKRVLKMGEIKENIYHIGSPDIDIIQNGKLPNIDNVKKNCQSSNQGLTYQKHMTHHIIDKDYSWMNPLINCFLIRNPKMVVHSFMKSWNDGGFEDIGFQQQYDIYKYVQENINDKPIIIDASKLRNDPKRVLSKFCEIVGLEWDEKMLSWSTGLKYYDGVWAKHWYPSVLNSTSFKPESKKQINLSDNEKTIVCLLYTSPSPRDKRQSRMPSCG